MPRITKVNTADKIRIVIPGPQVQGQNLLQAPNPALSGMFSLQIEFSIMVANPLSKTGVSSSKCPIPGTIK
eukprot:TRINITY_DN1207_c0_g1_i1.p3 TRINITY_DN1207_c0_g1~~TRINITY_DN1207_c0_g1_i1.p3  ORF type:complete len:71 (-),score=2.25 TRINITY_DN1207_c0_g1_i1:427-639(-)